MRNKKVLLIFTFLIIALIIAIFCFNVNADNETNTPEEPAGELMVGDLDKDGRITTGDAQAILELVADLSSGTEIVSEETMYLADVDGDGKITAKDATHILVCIDKKAYRDDLTLDKYIQENRIID